MSGHPSPDVPGRLDGEGAAWKEGQKNVGAIQDTRMAPTSGLIL